jgi:WD40 repeat protein
MHPQREIVLDLLGECARTAQEFYPAISVASLQLHHHVIPFLPIESRLSQVYGLHLQPGIDVKEGRAQMWIPCLHVLEGHTDRCNSVAFSPDGGRLVSGSDDYTIRLWDVQTGALLQIMAGHSDRVISVTYSSDGMHIASGSDDGTVRIWDGGTGLQVSTYDGHSMPVSYITFSEDCLHLA